jgi:hypothetical protein
MLEKLNSAEGVKSAILQHETYEIQRDLDNINDLANEFIDLTMHNQNPINFLV